MISKKTLKEYGFKSIEEYFNYIVDSGINGNFSQVRELFNKLNKKQMILFFNWLNANEIKFNFSILYK
jgi:hypothetical protein